MHRCARAHPRCAVGLQPCLELWLGRGSMQGMMAARHPVVCTSCGRPVQQCQLQASAAEAGAGSEITLPADLDQALQLAEQASCR